MKTLQTTDPILLSKWDNKSDKIVQSSVNMREKEGKAKSTAQNLITFFWTQFGFLNSLFKSIVSVNV